MSVDPLLVESAARYSQRSVQGRLGYIIECDSQTNWHRSSCSFSLMAIIWFQYIISNTRLRCFWVTNHNIHTFNSTFTEFVYWYNIEINGIFEWSISLYSNCQEKGMLDSQGLKRCANYICLPLLPPIFKSSISRSGSWNLFLTQVEMENRSSCDRFAEILHQFPERLRGGDK